MSRGKKKLKKTGPVPGRNSGVLPGERDERRMDPLARRLLILAVILVAAAQLLNMAGVIPEAVDVALSVLGLILLFVALAVQGRSGGGGGTRL